MIFVFTAKAENDEVGIAGDPAIAVDDKQLRFWLAHDYIVKIDVLVKKKAK